MAHDRASTRPCSISRVPLVVLAGLAFASAGCSTSESVEPAGADALGSDDSSSAGDTSGSADSAGQDSDVAGDADGSVPVDTGVAPPVDGGPSGVTSGPTGCKPLAIAAGAPVEGTAADTFSWSDAECLPRAASLLRNDKKDAFGEHGGYLRSISYVAAGKTRDIKGTGSNGWQGFGYIVSHYGSGGSASETQGIGGTYRTVLAGAHHAIHEFKWRIDPGGPVDVTVHWMFGTGRSHPLFAITYDASPAGSDVVKADSRAPYGDLAWDNGTNGDVTGVGWGDTHKFMTTGSGPVTPHSPWEYTAANAVPYGFEWSSSTDSEMGLVALQTFDTHVLGGDYGDGALSGHWGKTGSDLLSDIPDWQWPYQMLQYELPFETRSHRMAWGAQFGAVGQASYSSFGKTMSGYPFQSYTLQVVLGTHGASAVAESVAEVEALQKVKLTATRGTVAKDGAAGVGRTDKQGFTPAGFDPVYGAWAIDVAANAITATFDTSGESIANPVFELRGYSAKAAPSKVMLGGKPLVADVDYFATVDSAGNRLWLTLNATLKGAVQLSVE